MEPRYPIHTNRLPSYTHYLCGWCPECGRRRGADARCANCDPWWTSPLIQVGIPAVLLVLFAFSSAAALWGPHVSSTTPRVAANDSPVGRSSTIVVLWPGSPVSTAVVPVPAARAAGVMRVAAPTQTIPYPYVDAARAAQETARLMEMDRIRRDGEVVDTYLRAEAIQREEQAFEARRRAAIKALQQKRAPVQNPSAPAPSAPAQILLRMSSRPSPAARV